MTFFLIKSGHLDGAQCNVVSLAIYLFCLGTKHFDEGFVGLPKGPSILTVRKLCDSKASSKFLRVQVGLNILKILHMKIWVHVWNRNACQKKRLTIFFSFLSRHCHRKLIHHAIFHFHLALRWQLSHCHANATLKQPPGQFKINISISINHTLIWQFLKIYFKIQNENC